MATSTLAHLSLLTCGDVCALHGYIGSVDNNKVYIAVQPRSGIPARDDSGRFSILRRYCVFSPGFTRPVMFEIERIVSVGPKVAGFLAVDTLAHATWRRQTLV